MCSLTFYAHNYHWKIIQPNDIKGENFFMFADVVFITFLCKETQLGLIKRNKMMAYTFILNLTAKMSTKIRSNLIKLTML